MLLDIIKEKFPALALRNFRLFWVGQMVSLIGTWMQNIGQAWLVLQLTNSAFKLGIVNALQFLPMTFFSVLVGPVIDRFPKRRIVLFTQSSLMILALVFATLIHIEAIRYWHILILALLLGFVNTVDVPARQSFIIELVGRESLMNAIALNSAIFNLGRIIGPAVAGVLIGILGMATCFYLNAFSFCAVIGGLLLIKVPDYYAAPKEKISFMSEVKEGLAYIRSKKIILLPLLLLAVISTFTMNFNVLIPAFAKETLAQEVLGYGFLMTSMGLGSFFGALIMAMKSKAGPNLKVLFGAAFVLSSLMTLLGFLNSYLLSCLILFFVGFSSITFTASTNSIVQLNSDDRIRGRVMSVYSTLFGGMIPLGSIVIGKLIEVAGAHLSVSISGLLGLLALFVIIKLLDNTARYNNKILSIKR